MTAQPPAPSRQRWLVPVLVVVLSLTVGGGLLARELYQRPEAKLADAAAVAPATSVERDDQPGPGKVEVTDDVAHHPQGDAVRPVIQAYFDSINSRDYGKWRSTVSAERASQKPTEDSWKKDYRSTKDGSILIYRIEPAAHTSLRVLLAFTSTQSVDDAPENFKEGCIHWRLVLPMVFQAGGYKIDAVDSTGRSPESENC
ncbi:hypothetical protein [Amycolatopsis sp. PS_44_ISF1]|uniref:hypothetical protein n=1 Tax=Amycolatopsis sp. PS_44_ISF1 TaxID=2974917 RepID=UPI0028DF228B|nr:hypothetical protein [Amycolatopsis sp. PS_44_ISF1]MDT8915385.1 hypothetical protein [Amycolatopsis sp. PS_44_ISF1]